MPSKSEIEFCERWLDLRGLDGEVWGGEYLHPSFAGSPVVAVLLSSEGRPTLWDLTPRGADLVASYEAAVSLGLKIAPDDAPPPIGSGYIDCDPDGREREGRYDDCAFCVGDACNRCGWKRAPGEPRGCECDVSDRHEPLRDPVLVDCPECDDGWIGIPVGYGANGGVLRVWPATCPACKGANIGRPLAGIGEILDDQRAAWIAGTGADLGVIDEGWRQLTRAEGERLAGKLFEARRGVDDPPRRHVAMAEQPLASAGILRLVGGGNMRFDGTWWVRDAVAPEADVWQPLTHELAETLTGKRIEVQNARRRLFGQGKQTTALGISDCGKWIRVDVGASLSECYPLSRGWSVRVIDEAWVTEPAAMMALLEEARLEGFEVEVKATERPGGKSSHRKLGSGGPVALVHAFSAVQAYVNFTWCAVAGYRGEYVGASPILTAVRRAKTGGRHGDA